LATRQEGFVAHPDVKKGTFTGSTDVGKLIVNVASGNLKKVTLELGGKSSNMVVSDADREPSVPGVASAIFYHGQCYCAESQLYVDKRIFDKVMAGVADQAKQLK
jgi:phenylacetaldehyde dehydrogenase